MGNQHTENRFKAAIGLLAVTGVFFATGGTATAALATVIAGLSSEVAGEKLDHFLKQGYDAIWGNRNIKQPLQAAMAQALGKAVKGIMEGYNNHNPTLTKPQRKNIQQFLALFAETAPTTGYWEGAQQQDLLALAAQYPTQGEAALQQMLQQEAFTNYFQQQYQLPPGFAPYFAQQLPGLFNAHFRQLLTEGGPAKQALDLLYQASFQAQLGELLTRADSTADKLGQIEQALPKITEALQALAPAQQNDALLAQLTMALKATLRKEQDTLLKYLNPQPLLEYQWLHTADNDAVFRQRYLDYVLPPQQAWEQLVEFYLSPNMLEWWLVTGPAGTGKSRLALEFCLALHEQSPQPISAGLMTGDALAQYEWAQNTPQRPWLIVIDYAGGHKQALQKALEGLRAQESNGQLRHKVRLLLLERAQTNDFTDAGTKQLHLQLNGGSLLPYLPQPLALGQAEGEEKVIFARSIFADTLTKAGKTFTQEELVAYLESVYQIDPLLRPLFVFFCARAVAGGEDIRHWQTGNLLADWLDKHERPRWRQLLTNVQDDKALQPWLNLLAIATMCYGLTQQQAEQLYATAPPALLPQPPEDAQPCYHQYLGGIDNEVWRPLEPDVLGEYFVKQQFLSNEKSYGFIKAEKEKTLSQIANIVWQISPWGISHFLIRYFQDFGEDSLFQSLMEPSKNANINEAMFAKSNLIAAIATKYAEEERWLEAEAKEVELISLAQLSPESHSESASVIAAYIANIAAIYSNKNQPTRITRILLFIERLIPIYLHTTSAIVELSKAIMIILTFYSIKRDRKMAETLFELNEAIAVANGNPEVFTLILARAKCQLSFMYAGIGAVNEAEKLYDKLEQIALNNIKDIEIVETFILLSLGLQMYYREKNEEITSFEKWQNIATLDISFSDISKLNPDTIISLALNTAKISSYLHTRLAKHNDIELYEDWGATLMMLRDFGTISNNETVIALSENAKLMLAELDKLK